MIDLAAEHLDAIRAILRAHVPQCTVLVFGSRVNGTAVKYSDIDLALKCDTKPGIEILGRLKEAFAVSDLPISVDVVDYHSVSPEFKAIIDREYEELHF